MKRHCFLCSDLRAAQQAVAVLRRAGVDDSSLMLVARQDIRLDDLPAAGMARTDAIPGLARGLAAGGVVGTLGGIAILTFEGPGFALGGAAIAMFALCGAAVSGLAGFLAGASVPSSRLQPFEHAIQHDGRILLMLKARKEGGEELQKLIEDEIREIEYVGFEPRAPVIP